MRRRVMCRRRLPIAAACGSFLVALWLLLTRQWLSDLQVESMSPAPLPATRFPVAKRQLKSVCWSDDCLVDLLLSLPPEAPASVPAVRHLLLRNGSVSAAATERLRSWQRLHANWRILLWPEQLMPKAVAAFFPKYEPIFEGSFEQRSQLFRFLIALKLGGAFLPESCLPTGSQEPQRLLGATFVTRRRRIPESAAYVEVSSDFFMAAPRHPLVQFCADWLLHNHRLQADAHAWLSSLLPLYARHFPEAKSATHATLVARVGAESNWTLGGWRARVRQRLCRSATADCDAVESRFLGKMASVAGVADCETATESPAIADSPLRVGIRELQRLLPNSVLGFSSG